MSEPVLTPKGHMILAAGCLIGLLAAMIVFLGPVGTMIAIAAALLAGWLLSAR
jgi:hypothetical protein